MQHKNDYSVIVFLENDPSPKRWTYVHKLRGFVKFLDANHPSWQYFNVYERRTRRYLQRFYKGNYVPEFLCFFLTFNFFELGFSSIRAILYYSSIGIYNTVTIQTVLCG